MGIAHVTDYTMSINEFDLLLAQVKHFFKANEPRAQARFMLLSLAFQLAQVLPGLAEGIIEAIHSIHEAEDDQLAMDPGKLFDRCIIGCGLETQLSSKPIQNRCNPTCRLLLEPLTKFSANSSSQTIIILLDALDESDWGYKSATTRQPKTADPDEGHWRPVANLIIQK